MTKSNLYISLGFMQALMLVGCSTSIWTEPGQQTARSALSSEDIATRAASLAADPNFLTLREQWTGFNQTWALTHPFSGTSDPALLQTLNAADQGTDSAAVVLALTSGGFTLENAQQLAATAATLQQLRGTLDGAHQLGTLSPEDADAIVRLAWNETNPPEGLDCCGRYRDALSDCMDLALDYVWAMFSSGPWGGLVGALNVGSVYSEVMGCIGAADAKYKPCCH